jgi:hypothetical protein
MASEQEPDSQRPQDEVLTKVDALLRRHRGGGLDAALDVGSESEIPTLTELIVEPSVPERAAVDAGAPADAAPVDVPAPQAEALPDSPDDAWVSALQPQLERIVAETLAARLPEAIEKQVKPEVMLQLGEGLNRLREGMRATVESVVRETIEVEVKRALRALLKERER